MNDHKNRVITETFTDPLTVSEQESKFLQDQADEAKAAIGNAISEAKTALTQGMDPSVWAKKYPLIAVGAALAAGFATAAVTVSSKEQQELTKLRKIHEAIHPEPASAPAPASERPGFWHNLIREAIEMIRPVLTTALIASFKAPPSSQTPSDPPQGPPPG